MKLLVLKSLFVLDESFVNINISSMKKMVEYLSRYNENEIIIKFIGWINPNIDDSIINYIKHEINLLSNNSIFKIELIIWGKNLGKTHLLKNIDVLYPNYSTCDCILYADHDISPIDDILLDIHSLNERVNNKKIGIISFKQVPDDRHNPFIWRNKINLSYKTYYYSSDNIHVASGCILFRPELVNYLKLLYSDNVYGDEDIIIGELMNEYNYQSIVSSCRIHHPYCNNKDYESYKKNIIKDIIIKKYS